MIKDTWRGLWKAFQFRKRNTELVPLSALNQLGEEDIQKNLLPLFLNSKDDQQKQNFWNDIPTRTYSPDLAVSDDEDPSFAE